MKVYILPFLLLMSFTAFSQNTKKDSVGIMPGFVNQQNNVEQTKLNTFSESDFLIDKNNNKIEYHKDGSFYIKLDRKYSLDKYIEKFKYVNNILGDLYLEKSFKDNNGGFHYKYLQQINNIRIWGYELDVYEKDGIVYSANGKIFKNKIKIDKIISLKNADRIITNLLKSTTNSDTISPERISNNLNMSINPNRLINKIELYYFDTLQINEGDNSDNILTNKFCYFIESSDEDDPRVFIMDAVSGLVILNKSLLLNHNATTLYNNQQTINTTIYENSYILKDASKNISVLDKRNGGGIYYFTDTDNNWDEELYLSGLTINTIGTEWKDGLEDNSSGKPDFYFIVKKNGNIIYTSLTCNDCTPLPKTTTSTLYAFRILLNEPNCSIEIYDEDSGLNQDDLITSIQLNNIAGTYNFASSDNSCTGSYSLKTSPNPAVDVFWGLQKSFEYFSGRFGLNNIKANAYINLPISECQANNAITSTIFNTIKFGLGDNINKTPYTSLEIVAHEYSHLVIVNNSSINSLNLALSDNVGALNEGLADIFGVSIDFAFNTTANWLIGEKVFVNGKYSRSMEDPKTSVLANNDRGSDTYDDWYWQNYNTLTNKIYVRATVIGKWFYLLSHGGNGSNAFSEPFTVSAIGIDDAASIVYDALPRLPFYINGYDAFQSFRDKTIEVAREKYGSGSVAYNAVLNSWYAVNLWDLPGTNPMFCNSTTTLTNKSGSFDDGSGNSDYQNNVDCKWLIKPSGATSITLKFNYLNTEAGKDTIIIYNGNTLTSPRIGVYSGTTFPDSIVVTGSQVLVRFKTDAANTALGWSIKYTSNSTTTSSCSGLQSLTAASGTISDGSGTSNYVNNAECSWLIAPPGATSVTLNFTAFNTEQNFDFVTVYNGNNTYAPVLGTFSGTSLPSSLIANSGEMLVVFTSDGRTTAAGWSANYTSSGSSYCTGNQTLTTATGSLSDGSGSNNYQNRLDCNWLIKPNGASSVTLIFDSLDVEEPPVGLPGTYYDYVNVYDGQNANAPLIGTYAGSDIPSPITSSGNALFLLFHTDGRTTAKGWNAHYTSSTGQFCAGTTSLTTATGTFTDGSGASNYQSNSDCRWLIQPANATSIALTISPCDLEPGNDGILVYDGTSVNSPLLGTLTGSVTSQNFTSTSGQMLVRFQSDGQNNYSGFSATYTANISPLGSNYSITGYEYWFDDNSNSRNFVSTPHVYAYNLNTGIPVNTISTGLHTLNIRFLDNQDKWSSVLSSMFYKGLEENNTINNITEYEYWYDNNYTSKTAVTVSAQKVLNLNTGLNTTGLTTGVHVLNIRFKDSGKQWSSVLSSLFYKGLMDNNAVNNITEYEYWFDDNFVNKVSTSVSPQKMLNLNTGINATSLQQGVHAINIRFKDSGKQWSSVLSQLFYKNGSTTAPVNKVAAFRYWYDRSTTNITTVILPSPVNPHELISNIDVSSLAAGAHTVHFQFKDLMDSWSGVTNDTFNVVAPVKAKFIANDTTLCYRGTVTFTNQSTGALSYLWKFGDGDSSTSVNPSHTYNTPGFYTVTLVATNSQGVKDTLRKVNHISVTVPNVGVSPNVSICTGTSTQLVATGAVTYVWSPSTGLNTTTGSTVTATPGSNTTYRVIGTDQYGCIDTAFVTVNVSSVLQVGLSATQTTICQGDTVTLTASGANSYTWSPSVGLNGTTGNIVKAYPSVTTTYSVVGTSTCGSDTERVTITVKPKPTTSAGRDTSICTGKSVLLTATGATTYAWSNGVNTAGNTVAPISTTSYIVTGTTNGCSTKDTVLVSVNPLPSVNLPDVNICPGGSYTFDAGNPGSSYLWQNSTTNRQLTANTAGLYWVQVTNTFGCIKRDSATVTLSNNLTIGLRDTSICAGQFVILNAGNPGSTYSWSTGATTQTITVTQTNTYWVLVTASGGCSKKDTAFVNVLPLPAVTLNLIDTVSLNSPSFSLSGGLPVGGSYSGAGVVSGVFNPSIAGIGMHFISYTFIDVNGCAATKRDSIFVQMVTGISENKNDLEIIIFPNPTQGIVKFIIDNIEEDNGEIEIISNVGQLLFNDNIKILNRSEFTFDISNLASGIYYFKIRIDNKIKTYKIDLVK